MKELLSKKSLQPAYAAAIFLLLICAAPLRSGPRGIGLDMYDILHHFSESMLGYYIWVNLIVSALFILLAVPGVGNMVKEKTQERIRRIGCGFLAFFMVMSLLGMKHLAWGWGMWLIILLTTLLIVNVVLNRKRTPEEA